MQHKTISDVARERYAAGSMRRHATRAVFFIGGFGAASWAPLVPLLKNRLGIADDTLGMLLLCIGIGSLCTMPFSGAAAVRFGCRKVITGAAVLFALLLLGLCCVSSVGLAVPILLCFGAAMGCIDVVVNIQAVLVEKAAKRRLMSGMHALWSVGGFVGAGLFGVWVGGCGLTPWQSTLLAVAIMLVILAKFAGHLLPFGGESGGKLLALPRGIVVYVGIVALIAFLAEGAIMDWSGVFLTMVRGMDMSLAGTGFTVFSLAMLLMRLLGDATVQKLGAKTVVLGGSLLALLGFLLIIFVTDERLLFAGFFFVGIGSANIVPVFYSLLGKQRDMPLGLAVTAVSTLGYLGILMGPAAIGMIAQHFNLYVAFGFLAALTAIQFAVAGYVYKKVL